jgi:protein-S-isoprenylcysteine O-methyltransferase Ste14
MLPTMALIYRINNEEKTFLNEFGNKYKIYQNETKKLLPFIW